MNIRLATEADIPEILEMFRHAREIMKESGNPHQWNDLYPAEEDAREDMENGNCYICEENGMPAGVFTFMIGEEQTYNYIEEGQWGCDEPYGTIHRLASNGRAKGVAQACFAFCGSQLAHLRADTHEKNKILQRALEKFGFRRCGIIYVHGHSPRIAYEYRGLPGRVSPLRQVQNL